MRAPDLLLAALIVLPVSVSGSVHPAEPPAQEDGRGLVVSLDGWWVAPRNNELIYAFSGVGGLAGGGRVESLAARRRWVPRFGLAWRVGSARPTRLGMSFWEYDERARARVGPDPSNVGPLLASPAFLGFSRVDEAGASSRLRAIAVDGGARWPLRIGEGGVLRVDAELRIFRYERTVAVAYRRDFGQLRELFHNGASDARGIGPRAGLAYSHRFGRVRFGAGLGLALPVGEIESDTRQEFVVDGSLDGATSASEEGVGRVFVQVDAALDFEVRIGRGWTAELGWRLLGWSAVEQQHRFVDVAGQAAAVVVERDAVFEGVRAGLRYEF